ncbi:hypothetical protein NN6n1_05260 [Shinella zoogloeoides]
MPCAVRWSAGPMPESISSFGVLMVVMMIWKPRGLVHIKRPAFFPSTAAERDIPLAAKPEAAR